MYLLDLFYDTARVNGAGEVSFRGGDGTVRKWTVLDADANGLELIRMLALVCIGEKHVEPLASSGRNLTGEGGGELRLEAVGVQHAPRDCSRHTRRLFRTVLCLLPSGQPSRAAHPLFAPPDLRPAQLGRGSGVRTDFAVGYGARLVPHRGTDCFDFTEPFPRARRFQSLFDERARVTDPVAFLTRLQYRARRGRLPAKRLLALFVSAFGRTLGVPTEARPCEPLHDDLPGHRPDYWQGEWDRLDAWQQAVLLPVLGAARHVVDASPHELAPLTRPGVVLLHAPDLYCPEALFAAWIEMLDRLFPATQFVISLSGSACRLFPDALRQRTLPIHDEWALQASRPPRSRARLSPGTALLVDVDGRMPNVALMKLSTHLAGGGWRRELARGADWRREGADRVLASCVFDFESSHRRVAQMREYYGTKLTLGGSGVDVSLRLPADIEEGVSDYGLYPDLGDRAIGFLTRGCPRRCRFCIVPRKEGLPRQVAALEDLLQGSRKELILLDDNLLAHPDADRLLQELAERRLSVNFNQTLDIRLVDAHRARLLRTIRCSNAKFTRRNYHFSLNDARDLDLVRRNYELFGFTAGDNVQFVCMYGYLTSLAEDVRRFAFLKSLPGAYVFMQRYRPVLAREVAFSPRSFFRGKADELIDQLIRIVFTQNMKSMEVYYRWLSARYFETFGKLHMPLVDVLFRYNRRDEKGVYIARMLASKERVPPDVAPRP